MTVDPQCQGLLGEIPGYVWAPARGGGLKEEPVKVERRRLRRVALCRDGPRSGDWSVAVA